MVLILAAGCAGVVVRGLLRWAAGRQSGGCGGCGGCAKCEPTPGEKPGIESPRRIVFLPVEHLRRKR